MVKEFFRQRESVLEPHQVVGLLTDRFNKKPNAFLLKQAIVHPARGYVDNLSRYVTIKDLVEAKKLKIDRLVDFFTQQGEGKADELSHLLWDIAVAEDPGYDVNDYAVKTLVMVGKYSPDFINDLKKEAFASSSKKAVTAGRILYERFSGLNFTSQEQAHFRKLFHIYNGLFTESVLAFKASNLAMNYPEEVESWVRLESLHLYKEKLKRVTDFDGLLENNSLEKEINKEIQFKLEKLRQMSRLKKLDIGMPTLGLEIQGNMPISVPHIKQEKPDRHRYILTNMSKTDYDKITMFGDFIRSSDRLYEFALKPSINPLIQSLLTKTLVDSGYVSNTETSINITIGGLKSSEFYREPAVIQLMLLAGDYLRRRESLIDVSFPRDWFVGTNKLAIHNRSKKEMQTIGTVRTGIGSELRLPGLVRVEDLDEGLLLIKQLGRAAIEKQRELDGVSHNKKLARLWDEFAQQGSVLFQEVGLPSLNEIWQVRDLTSLNKILEGQGGVNFISKMRTILQSSTARIELIDSHRKVSTNEKIEKTNGDLLNRVLNKYEKTLNFWQHLITAGNKDNYTGISLLKRLALSFATAQALYNSRTFLKVVDNLEPNLLLLSVLAPEVMKSAIIAARNLKKGKPEVGWEFSADLYVIRYLGYFTNIGNLLGVLKNDIDTLKFGSPESLEQLIAKLAPGIIFHLGSLLSEKFIRNRVKIESYD